MSYKEKQVSKKNQTWIKELHTLSKIAKSESQAVFECFINGHKPKFTYCMCTTPNTINMMRIIDDLLTTEFIPATTGGITCSIAEKKLLALLPTIGGLGILIFNKISDLEYENSKLLTEMLYKKNK